MGFNLVSKINCITACRTWKNIRISLRKFWVIGKMKWQSAISSLKRIRKTKKFVKILKHGRATLKSLYLSTSLIFCLPRSREPISLIYIDTIYCFVTHARIIGYLKLKKKNCTGIYLTLPSFLTGKSDSASP